MEFSSNVGLRHFADLPRVVTPLLVLHILRTNAQNSSTEPQTHLEL